jgi:hypothetical protein
MKKVLVGLALVFALGACGTAASSGPDYSRLDDSMNQHPELVTQVCDARASLLGAGVSETQIFGLVESAGAFRDYPDIGATDRQIYDHIVGRC